MTQGEIEQVNKKGALFHTPEFPKRAPGLTGALAETVRDVCKDGVNIMGRAVDHWVWPRRGVAGWVNG